MHSVVQAIGHYLPEKILRNADLDPALQTSDSWIRERTGIAQRHIAAPDQATSDLAAEAARVALAKAGLAAEQIDLVIVATTTPDETLPATATRVQQKLGTRGFAYDLQAACSGFVYGLAAADSMLKNGLCSRALVIGAETYSRIVDWNDRGTCILFGDGAGAAVVTGEANESSRGVLASDLGSDGNLADILKSTGGVSTTGTAGVITMQGREVFRHAVARMCESLEIALVKCGLSVADIDWLVPHQANARILASVGEKLDIPPEKVVMTMDRHANTSAASIPLALAVADTEGKLKPGDVVAMPALGAGLTWGTCIIRW